LVVLVIADDHAIVARLRRGAEAAQQALQPAGVLGGDDVGASQLLGQPRRCVADLTDRGRREDDDTLAFSSHARDPPTPPPRVWFVVITWERCSAPDTGGTAQTRGGARAYDGAHDPDRGA